MFSQRCEGRARTCTWYVQVAHGVLVGLLIMVHSVKKNLRGQLGLDEMSPLINQVFCLRA